MYLIKIKSQFEALHRYIQAPEDVSFLRNYHKHVFKVEVVIETKHDNRDLEFYMVKRNLDFFLLDRFKDAEMELSCEAIAEEIFNHLKIIYPTIRFVEVSEDDNNSGLYMYV